MSSKIRGVVPPLAIPLKDGELDVPSLERHINRMIVRRPRRPVRLRLYR